MPAPVIVEVESGAVTIASPGPQGPPGPSGGDVLGTIATHNLTVSTQDPSGGVDTDLWFKYIP